MPILIVCPSGKFKNDKNAFDYMCVHGLIAAGADLETRDRSSNTALHISVET